MLGSIKVCQITHLLSVLFCVECSHNFMLPEGCNAKGDPSSNNSWTCLFIPEERMTCWFNVVKLFNISIDKETTYNATILYSIGIYDKTQNLELKGKCLQIHDSNVIESGLSSMNISLQILQNKDPINTTVEFYSLDYTKANHIKRIHYNTTSSSASLVLELSKKLARLGKEIRIRYRSQHDSYIVGSWQEKRQRWKRSFDQLFSAISGSDWSVFKMKILLTNLTTFTIYDVTIDVIFCDDVTCRGFWSDALNLSFTTKEDVPIDVPGFLSGYFTSHNDSNIQIFWKPIEQIKRCGIITSFMVEVSCFSLESEIVENQTIILIPPNRTSFILSVVPNKINQINITQRTRMGYPEVDDASIYVFPKHHRPKPPRTVFVEIYNFTSIEMTWAGVPENVISINIVWCYGTRPGHCIEPIESRTFPFNNTNETNSANITVTHGTIHDNIYGIYVETESENMFKYSSGISWYSDCLYKKEGVPQIGPNISAVVTSDSMIHVKWNHYSCQESVVRIGHYIVTYCETNGKNCTDEVKSLLVSGDQYSFAIKNLENGKTYEVKVGTKLRRGQENGPWSNTLQLTIPESKQFDKDPILIGPVAGAASAFVVFITVFIIVFIHICRKRLKKAKEKAIQIELPVIQKSLYPVCHQSPSEYGTSKHGFSNDSGLGESLNVKNHLNCNESLSGYDTETHSINHIINKTVSSLPVKTDTEKIRGHSPSDDDLGKNKLDKSEGYQDIVFIDSEDEEDTCSSSGETDPLCDSRTSTTRSSTDTRDNNIENDNTKDTWECFTKQQTKKDSKNKKIKHLHDKFYAEDTSSDMSNSNISSYCKTGFT